ncbi:hypothetical protein ACQP3I_29425, partial [Escherichia coli]
YTGSISFDFKITPCYCQRGLVYLKQHIIGIKGYFNMLPEHLVPSHFHLSSPATNTNPVDNSENLTQGKRTLSDYESDILSSSTVTGQSR